MAHVDVIVDGRDPITGRGAFADVADRLIRVNERFRIVGVPRGAGLLATGEPLVAVGIPLPATEGRTDGQWAMVALPLANFLTAADMLKERYGDPRQRGRF